MIYQDVQLYNTAEIVQDEGGFFLLRVPNCLRMSLNPAAKSRARYPTACEIRFNLKSPSARIVLQCVEDEYPIVVPGVLQVFQGVFSTAHHFVGKEPTEIVVSLPPNIELLDKLTREKQLPYDPHLTRILLPHFAPVKLLNIEGQTTPPKPEQTPRKKYLAYGSSITHGRAALAPSGTYPMRTAQILGVDLINLGFGAGAHCERELADYIAERDDWDFATLEIGINMIGGFETSEFKRRVEYFVRRIARAHPDRLIVCIDLFPFYPGQEYAFVPTLERQDEFRSIVRRTVKQIGGPHLIYLAGGELLENVSGLSVDLVHPSPAGMEEIARNLSRQLQHALNENVRASSFQ